MIGTTRKQDHLSLAFEWYEDKLIPIKEDEKACLRSHTESELTATTLTMSACSPNVAPDFLHGKGDFKGSAPPVLPSIDIIKKHPRRRLLNRLEDLPSSLNLFDFEDAPSVAASKNERWISSSKLNDPTPSVTAIPTTPVSRSRAVPRNDESRPSSREVTSAPLREDSSSPPRDISRGDAPLARKLSIEKSAHRVASNQQDNQARRSAARTPGSGIDDPRRTFWKSGRGSDVGRSHSNNDRLMDSPRRRLGRKTQSAIDLVFLGHGPDRDTCPRAPRRGSFNNALAQSSAASSGANSPAKNLTGNDLKSHVMARIPAHVMKQLESDQWEHIFSVLAEKVNDSPRPVEDHKRALSESVRVDRHSDKEDQESYNGESCDDESINASSVVSALTNPESEWQATSDLPVVERKAEGKDASMTLPSRSWHGGASNNEGAPKIPSRGSHGLPP